MKTYKQKLIQVAAALQVITAYSTLARIRNKHLRIRHKQQAKLPANNWLSYKNRKKFGASSQLIPNFRKYRTEKFINFLRLTPSQFDALLKLVHPLLKMEHHIKRPISPKTRLEITLR
jgi:hypothetical protein